MNGQDVDSLLACLPLSDDGTGHVVDCGYTDEGMTCGCLTLPARLTAAVEAIVAARLASVKAWFDALENIQRAYADIVMDTPEERETHRKLVVIADLGLREARAVLGSDAHTEQKGTGDA